MSQRGAAQAIEVGTIYEDCAYHPVLCTMRSDADDELQGISLIDGRIRCCSIHHCGPEPLTLGQVLVIKKDFDRYVRERHAGGSVPPEV